MARQDWIDYILANAARYGIDPQAALAVASVEGLSGGVGDAGTSFGPFQLHVGGALPTGRGRAWAESPAGIDYALRQIGAVSRGLRGRAAIEKIVREFERPAAPDAEIRNAWAAYNAGVGGGGTPPAPNARQLSASTSAGGGGGGIADTITDTIIPQAAPPTEVAPRMRRRFSPLNLAMGINQSLLAGQEPDIPSLVDQSWQETQYNAPVIEPPQPVAVPKVMAKPMAAPKAPPETETPPPPMGVAKAAAFRTTPMVALHGTQTPQRIILHTTESEGDPQSVVNYWAKQGRGYGAQFVIGNDGTVLQTADPTALTWHAGGMNTGSVGIEIAGMAKYTRAQWMKRPKQLQAIARTIAQLSRQYGIQISFGPNGVWTHAAVSRTHPQSEGHSDPGAGFPLQLVMQMARSYLA